MASLKQGILQIIVPFTPVWVVFDDGKGDKLYEQVHMWALVEYADKTRGIEGLGLAGGDLVLLEDRADFLGYVDVVPFYNKRLSVLVPPV